MLALGQVLGHAAWLHALHAFDGALILGPLQLLFRCHFAQEVALQPQPLLFLLKVLYLLLAVQESDATLLRGQSLSVVTFGPEFARGTLIVQIVRGVLRRWKVTRLSLGGQGSPDHHLVLHVHLGQL
jgi:hypothetical protein